VQIAAEGHRQLCLGQGAELDWARQPAPLASAAVLDIFRRKTSPAFEVALRLGAAIGGADAAVHETLARYSEALGIAYQVRDDLEDLARGEAESDLVRLRPSLPLAIAWERANGPAKDRLAEAWRNGGRRQTEDEAAALRALVAETKADSRCSSLLEAYKEQAIRTLPGLSNASLKGLLRRVIGKIFAVEIKGWCSEFEARNAAGGEARAAAAR
jgi:geranylgeranyl pyrophosphate synthase